MQYSVGLTAAEIKDLILLLITPIDLAIYEIPIFTKKSLKVSDISFSLDMSYMSLLLWL